ncbi:hypothetical protein [Ignavibacterium sp.]|uniref:hypothetical protein n=1 Tax=Ignavibacterium sp. TaxID=2651167 RepID=UPI00307D9975
MKYNYIRVKKYLRSIITSLSLKSDGYQRDLLRILYRMKLSDKNEGLIFDACIRLWEQIGKAPYVRGYSI